jgi:lysophospholipase L1-like esterase
MKLATFALAAILGAGCQHTTASRARDADVDTRASTDATAVIDVREHEDAAPNSNDARDAAAARDAPPSSEDLAADVRDLREAGSAGDAPVDHRDAAADVGRDATAVTYRPCPSAGTTCVIMPIGDSITFGYDSSTGGGYRLRLLHDIWTAKGDATFVGDDTSGPDTLDGRPVPKHNEGYSGYTIDPAPAVGRAGISPLVRPALMKYAPNVVTLMIGTNDVATKNDLSNAPARLAALIDVILATSPAALLVVAQITPIVDDQLDPLVRAYNAEIPALVKARADAGKHILLVDMYAAFTADPKYATDYMNGSLHPGDKGYDVMGDVWYAALAPHL